MKKCLIVGLGNPGKKYENTRHNAGFMFLDYLIKEWDFPAFKSFNKSLLTHSRKNFKKHIFLLKPMNYMNLSGVNVSEVINYYNILIEDILVVHDDKDLKIGAFKIKFNGGAGGHNGVKNIMNQLLTSFWKIKLGIGYNQNYDMAQYVLLNFPQAEKISVEKTFSQIEKLLSLKYNEDLSWEKANSFLNNKPEGL